MEACCYTRIGMDSVRRIESEIKKLSVTELAAFREWFARFDADLWDRQLEDDVEAGKLDAFADRALRDHQDGHSTKL